MPTAVSYLEVKQETSVLVGSWQRQDHYPGRFHVTSRNVVPPF